MASKRDQQPTTERTLPESMGLADALAQKNPLLAARLARKNAAKLTPEQQEVLATLLDADDSFGARQRDRIMGVRLGTNLAQRLERFMHDHKRAEKSRIVEVALDHILREVGY